MKKCTNPITTDLLPYRKRHAQPRCKVCGKYIEYADFDNGKAFTEFTPDTPFTFEKTEHIHKKCN